MDELAWADASAQAEMVRKGELSPAELVAAAIGRALERNPDLNAIIHERYDTALAEARAEALPDGPFRGVPFAVKDLGCPTAGDPYHCGTRFLRDAGYVAPADSHLAGRFRAAGFVSLGKTNTPEIGASATTEPWAFGATRNPWHPDRSPGGSSGGSAAAVAAGIVPIAHASDGGGSIRIPASACGLVGLKVSRGRVSAAPGPDLLGLSVHLAVTRSVRDTAAILDCVAGPAVGDHVQAPPPVRPFAEEVHSGATPLRAGLMTDAPGRAFALAPECVAAAETAARVLESLGHTVEVAHPAVLDEPAVGGAAYTAIWGARIDALAKMAGTEPGPDGLEPATWMLVERARALRAPEVVAAFGEVQGRTRDLHGWWASGWDLLVTPTLGALPPALGYLAGTTEEPFQGMARSGPFTAFTMPFNQSGQPAISLPLYWTDENVPVGVQLVAAWGREDVLIRVAADLEQALPWAHRYRLVPARPTPG
jgi:amidase